MKVNYETHRRYKDLFNSLTRPVAGPDEPALLAEGVWSFGEPLRNLPFDPRFTGRLPLIRQLGFFVSDAETITPAMRVLAGPGGRKDIGRPALLELGIGFLGGRKLTPQLTLARTPDWSFVLIDKSFEHERKVDEPTVEAFMDQIGEYAMTAVTLGGLAVAELVPSPREVASLVTV